MSWIRRFMIGRNGPDQLSLATLIASVLLTILSLLFRVAALEVLFNLLSYVCLVFFFFRILSRDVYRRRNENARYMEKTRKFREWVRLRGRMVREAKTYRYLRCPTCKQWLRVPRGKGKIRVSCRTCGEQFERKV